MHRLPIIALLAATVPGSIALAGPIPWFHTRPKPVILEEPAHPATTTRVAYHGTAVYPKTGRLYIEDSRDRLKQEQSSKFHIQDVFPLNWWSGTQSSKPNSSRTK
jgi:hypothetical protein